MSPVSRMRPSAIAIAPDANVVKRSSIVTRRAVTRIVSQSMTESIAYVPYHRTVRPRVAVARDRRVRLWLRRLGFDLTLTFHQQRGVFADRPDRRHWRRRRHRPPRNRRLHGMAVRFDAA